MSTTDARSPLVRIGNKSPRSGNATVEFEVVMTEEERDTLLERVTSGETPLNDREATIEALGIAPEEG